MRPRWFSIGTATPDLEPIPYTKMWADDVYWVPLLLAGEKFAGRADFTADSNTMIKYWFGKEVKA